MRDCCFAKTLLLAGTAALALTAGLSATAQAKDITLVMAAPDWPPTRFLQEEANRSYKAPSGNNVTIQVDFIPWGTYYDRLAASLTSGEQKYNMVVTDSQWLGAFVEGGYYLDLTDMIAADPELQEIMKDIHPALVSAYSTYPTIAAADLQDASYPYDGAHYYGFPQMPDEYLTWYRTDLFCNEKEQADFQAQFQQKLPCTPEDWKDVDWDTWGNIGQFFTRPAGAPLGDGTTAEPMYGVAYQAGKSYDNSSMQINAFIWQWGGDTWDETKQPEAQAEGVVNSPEAVAGFERYLDLLQYAPPVATTGQMDIFQVQEQFMQGRVAAVVDWVGLGAPVLDPNTSQVSDKVGFAVTPGRRGPDGQIQRWSNIGGQPFVLTTWNDEDELKEALDFVKWWESPEVQIKFAQNGGQSGRMSIMNSPEYASYMPWNQPFVEMLPWQRDVLHIPEFFELITQQQEEFDKAITGQSTAQEALDAIAAFQQSTLEEAGRIEEP